MKSKNKICLEKICYTILWVPSTLASRIYFNFKIKGKENLPKKSAILVANHCTPLDGFLVSSVMYKQMHFWVQYENIYDTKSGKILETIGEVFVKVDKKENIGTIKDTENYLKKTKDYIGIFPEGPVKDLDKSQTPYSGATYLAYLTGKDIIPLGIFVPKKQKQFLEENASLSNFHIINFLKKYYRLNKIKRIPYYINIGKPVDISTVKSENKKQMIRELTDYIMEECYRLAKEASK